LTEVHVYISKKLTRVLCLIKKLKKNKSFKKLKRKEKRGVARATLIWLGGGRTHPHKAKERERERKKGLGFGLLGVGVLDEPGFS
jgi:hypothetical protein